MNNHNTQPHPKNKFLLIVIISLALSYALVGCTFGFDSSTQPIDTGNGGSTGGNVDQGGDTAQVTRIIDGDTIDVKLANGTTERVRYIGMNTPESDQVCYSEATQANSIFVKGKSVRLVKDVSDRDVYGRLLRYVYVGDLFVNRAMVEQGYAEAVLYEPDHAHYDEFVTLEKQATSGKRGCHPSGIFNDGSYTR